MKPGHNSGEGFERQDLGARPVYQFLIGLAAAGVLVYFVIWGFYHSMDAYARRHQPKQGPLVQQVETDTRVVSPSEIDRIPRPRLESNERLEINEFRLKEEQALNSYAWVDQKAGVVRIPIERAMQLVAQQGLPTMPKSGTAPPSAVNVAREAATRADTGTKAKKPK